MYAIVRAGGRQEKVAVGDVISQDRVDGDPGTSVMLSAVLVVDGTDVTSDADMLRKVKVVAEIVEHNKGVKIDIGKFKNKTGYRRRQGHRQYLSTLRVTAIETGK